MTASTKVSNLIAWLNDRATFVNDPNDVETGVYIQRTVVLVREKHRMEWLADTLRQHQYRAEALHGGSSPTRQEQLAKEFIRNSFDIVVMSTAVELLHNFPVPKFVIVFDLRTMLSAHLCMISDMVLVDVENSNDKLVLRTIYGFMLASGRNIPEWMKRSVRDVGEEYLSSSPYQSSWISPGSV